MAMSRETQKLHVATTLSNTRRNPLEAPVSRPGHRFAAVALFDPFPPLPTELGGFVRLIKEVREFGGKVARVVGATEQPSPSRRDHFRKGPSARRSGPAR